MQFKLALLALVGSAAAAPALQARQANAITGALGNINTALQGLDTSVKAFNGDAAQLGDIQTKSTAVQKAITDGTASVQASQPITIADALQVQKSSTTLVTTIKSTVTDLTGKKAMLDQIQASPIVLMGLQMQKQAAMGLQTAVVAKVPAGLQNTAQSVSGQISAALDTGIQAFS